MGRECHPPNECLLTASWIHLVHNYRRMNVRLVASSPLGLIGQWLTPRALEGGALAKTTEMRKAAGNRALRETPTATAEVVGRRKPC